MFRPATAALSLLVPLLTWTVGAPDATAAAPAVTVVGPAVTVRPGDQPIGTAGATLRAARNEFASFQVVVAGGAAGVTGLDVALQPDQVAGSPLGADNVTIYREAYVDVPAAAGPDATAGPSDGEISHAGGDPTGRWPDALIPKVDPWYGEARNAFPVNVPAGENRVAWVDVFVPVGTPAGAYGATLSVTGNGSTSYVDVALDVLEMDLPATSSLPSAFTTAFGDYCNAFVGDFHCGTKNGDWDYDEEWRLQSLFERVALENRITVSNPLPAPFGYDTGPPTGTMASYFASRVQPLLDGADPTFTGGPTRPMRLRDADGTTARMTSFNVWWHCADNGTCLGDWKTFADAHAFGDRLFYYACDEPPSDSGGNDWSFCKNHLAKSTTLPKLATTTIKDAAAQGITGNLDRIVVALSRMAQKPQYNTGYEGDQRSTYDAFLDPADNTPGTPANSLWLYTSNLQCGAADGGQYFGPGWDSTLWDGWAGYAIDQPATQARAMPWEAYEYDASGELYYKVSQRLRTAWHQQFEQGCNGDGTLFYPGLPAGRAVGVDSDAPAIGGTHSIPIESIRLKRIRDGRQDYEYLRRAGAVDAPATSAVVDAMFTPAPPYADTPRDRATYTATWTQAALDDARDQLVAIISPTAPPPWSGRIAYVAQAGLGTDIHVTTPDGGDVTVTPSPAVEEAKPSLSPDGTKVVYAARAEAGTWDIVTANADGSGDVQPVAGAASGTLDEVKPAWSPDGSRILFTRMTSATTGDVCYVRADGTGGRVNVSADTDWLADDGAWSPDGLRVAYTLRPPGGTSDIYLRSIAGGTLGARVKMPGNASGADDDLPAWSPDGTRIAFDSYRTGDYDVFTVSTAAGSVAAPAVHDPGEHEYDPVWAPDGVHLAFAHRPVGSAVSQVGVVRLGAATVTDVTAGGSNGAPDWWAPRTRADLTLTHRTTSGDISLGNQLTRRIVVRNSGPAAAAGVVVSESVPAGTVVLSTSTTVGTCQGRAPVVCTVGQLPVGSSATVVIRLGAVRTGLQRSTARVAATTFDDALADDTVAVANRVVSPTSATRCSVRGTAGNDVLRGTAGNDVVCGFDGRDTIRARDGRDTVFAGAGGDTVYGGAGRDWLFGQSGRDHLYGQSGDDVVDGGADYDTCTQGDGTRRGLHHCEA